MVAKPPVWGLIANYFLCKSQRNDTKQNRISMDTLCTLKKVVESSCHFKVCISITTEMLTKMFTSYGRFFCKDGASNDIIVKNQEGLLEELAYDQDFTFDAPDDTRRQYKKAILNFVQNSHYTPPKHEELSLSV